VTDAASQSQIAAANPTASVWLHANAGSGKTKVLIDRVARLLLSGVEPQHVLCLTYTKAAAAEMQNRLFERLGKWAMMPDAVLAKALSNLGPLENQQVPDMARARQLFARAIETPGGLRIQTIHSFCASLLRRFPLEAGVSPQFRDLDDRSASLMRSEIAQEIASGPHAAAFDGLARNYTGDDLDGLLSQIAAARGGMAQFLDEADARALFQVPVGETMEGIISDVFLGDEDALFARILPIARAGSKNDIKEAERIAAVGFGSPDVQTLRDCEDIFLYGEKADRPYGDKTEKLFTKSTNGVIQEHKPELDAFIFRIEAARPRRIALQAALKTAALHDFARHFLPAYAARKAAQGMLDFDDQIALAKALLSDFSVAQWVLYRLDGGIEHILVDEAQDTSPDQWEVLERLTDAFMDGEPGRKRTRTMFVVGDRKQSIYSFQGADVSAFDSMKQRFTERLANVGQRLDERDMLHSFRSSPAVLEVVDATFDRDDTESIGGPMQHIAFFDGMPGRVEVWPRIEPQSVTEEQDGFSPVDLTTDEHHAVQMGKKVADWINAQLDMGLQVPKKDGVRRAAPGDFLVLVQRRSKIFDAVIAECKARKLPIAGADRLVLDDALAVRDMVALLSFLATDNDDLSLAIVMRSPLGGLTEAELYHLAQGRSESLWLRLVDNAALHPALFAMLVDLRNVADVARPFDLLDRALTRHGGRLRILARLGQEAEDAIDELLAQALAYEAAEVPSITGFLSWLTAGSVEVKRQMESDGGQIRVMTVHGAKGLEAPIVILPDTAEQNSPDRQQVVRMAGALQAAAANAPPERPVVWTTSADESPLVLMAEKALRKAKRQEEDDRLLYVAMTRAQSLLVVGAAGKISKDSRSWHSKISAGMVQAGATVEAEGVLVHRFGHWPENELSVAESRASEVLPDWAKAAPAAYIAPKVPVSPSDLGGPKALPGEAGQDIEVALARGERLHALLEHLPQHPADTWSKMAKILLAEDLLEEAARVIAQHPLVFAPETLAEVPITAEIGGQRLLGVIDRLIVGNDRVMAVDFKSNRVVPGSAALVPEGILRQMGAYAAALTQIYPGKHVETAVLWTRTGKLMLLDPEIVSAALLRALPIDVPDPAA
jgi:ATP-dependent helicase/nuclease subunit A